MNDPDEFTTFIRLAGELIGKASKDHVADAARLLALNIGYYHEKYGDVPQETPLGMVRAESLHEESKRLLLHGRQNLVSALGEVLGITEDSEEAAVH
jgi:hypothetical protein